MPPAPGVAPPAPPASAAFRTLDASHILATLARLAARVEERFPGAGLAGIARELLATGRDVEREVAALARPNWPIRAAVGAAIVLMVVAVVAAALGIVQRLQDPARVSGLVELVQGIEAAVNDVVFLGVAIWFLGSIEARLKRRTALRRLHQLRSIAHIVDMHQLTKDPEHLLAPQPETASSPRRTMTRGALGRYLDYCSELLSLTAKLGALYAQGMDDPVVLGAVNEIEDLTNALSRKVWQKIALLDRAPPGVA